jgi:hypothetical protein
LTELALIDQVKPRLGVFYSEANKDAEIQGMIDGAVAYFLGAGWAIDTSAPSALAVEAVVLYCKMAQSTDPAQLMNHPVLLSFVTQGRTQPSTVATPAATPPGGSYAAAQSVELECSTLEADIYYTLDGTDPTEESDLYSGAITIPAGATIVIKAKAFRYGWYDSAVMTETYVVS